MLLRTALIVTTTILLAAVVQITLFGQFRFVTPDLVMLVVILLALTRIRKDAVLGVAFAAGLLIDLIGSSLTGLRAVVFTIVAFAAIRTRERAEIGRFAMAIWTGLLTFVGVVSLVLVGTLFGQTSLLGPGVTSRLFQVPLANLILAAMLAPKWVRLVDRDSTAYRFT